MNDLLRGGKTLKRKRTCMNAATSASAESLALLELDEVFWELVSEQRNRAIAIAYHMLGGDRQAAEDVTQDAFIRAYRALPGFQGRSKLSTWFFRILINRIKTYRRRQWVFGQQKKNVEEELRSDVGPDRLMRPERSAESGELRRRILIAVRRLSVKQRAVFGMVHLEGNSLEETAEHLSISVGTAKSHLHRALQKLRDELRDLERL